MRFIHSYRCNDLQHACNSLQRLPASCKPAIRRFDSGPRLLERPTCLVVAETDSAISHCRGLFVTEPVTRTPHDVDRGAYLFPDSERRMGRRHGLVLTRGEAPSQAQKANGGSLASCARAQTIASPSVALPSEIGAGRRGLHVDLGQRKSDAPVGAAVRSPGDLRAGATIRAPGAPASRAGPCVRADPGPSAWRQRQRPGRHDRLPHVRWAPPS